MPPDPRFFPVEGPLSVERLAGIADAEIVGPEGAAERLFSAVAALDEADANSVSFLDNKAYVEQYRQTEAGCCIVASKFVADAPGGMICLVTETPYLAYARIAEVFYPGSEDFYCPTGSDPVVHPSASVGTGTIVGAGTVVGPDVEIGTDCRIGPNVYIGSGVRIGDHCTIGPQVSVRFAIIGDHVSLFAGVRIGEPGFGFAVSPVGAVTVPQLGRVLIEDYVEVGANTTIDRGAGPDTVIGAGTRIDNLVQIGHNVRMGQGCVVVAQSGVAGSTVLSDFVVLAAQSGVSGHLKIAPGTQLAARSGIMRDTEPGAKLAGNPAIPAKEYFRQMAVLGKLAKDRHRKN